MIMNLINIKFSKFGVHIKGVKCKVYIESKIKDLFPNLLTHKKLAKCRDIIRSTAAYHPI